MLSRALALAGLAALAVLINLHAPTVFFDMHLMLGSGVAVRRLATDRYGREVVELSHRGRNVNQALVARGAAFVYWAYIRGCDRQTYGRLETQARLQRLGVWATPGGLLRPWELRARSRR